MIRVIYLPQGRECAVDITKSEVLVLLTVTLMLPGMEEEVRSADLRKGFPEVSLPRPQLSYNRPGPAELGPAWLGSATPLLAQEKLGATGASPSLLSCLTFV